MAPDNAIIQSAWDQYTRGGASLDTRSLRPEIVRSWQRCHNLSVDPLRPEASRVDLPQLRERLARHHQLVRIVRPVMERLYDFVKGTGFQVVLSDETGLLLDAIGDPQILSKTRGVELCPGGDWSEASKGTNAIGTAIFERKPVQVFAAEHYCEPNHFLVCSAAPIFDSDGQIVGVLDLSGDYHQSNAHTLGMVVAAVGSIETQLRLQRATEKLYDAYRYSNILLDSISDGLISVDNAGFITEINWKGAGVLGVDSRLIRGKHITELGCKLPLLDLLKGGPRYEDKEICIQSGKKVRSSGSLLRDESGRTIGAIATFREISKWKSLTSQHYLASPSCSVVDIIGSSEAMTELKARTRMAASSISTVLIEGESGTGKELVAKAIHHDGPRGRGPFVAVNCAALPESLIESELFGYEEGSFTGAKKGGQAGKFELANGGTLFLDEIGDMPLTAQMKLLRVIQERKVARIGATVDRDIDIRIIAATLKDLKQEVKAGRFRQDLYYRLNVLNLRVPPLHERAEDIPELARYLCAKISVRLNVAEKGFDEGLLEQLKSYSWPGNVRELENTIERAINLAGNEPVLRPEHFEFAMAEAEPKATASTEVEPVRPLGEMEKEMILKALRFYKGNIQKAAASLQISRNTLYRKLKEFKAEDAAFDNEPAEPSNYIP
jgi:transcriptional regulator of acetoin/glycerol metabolism